MAFAPVFLANLIFAQRFRDVGASTVAFGANLLGAMLGGVLEYLAIVTGYRTLLVLVAAALRSGVPHGPPTPSVVGSGAARRERRARPSDQVRAKAMASPPHATSPAVTPLDTAASR